MTGQIWRRPPLGRIPNIQFERHEFSAKFLTFTNLENPYANLKAFGEAQILA